MDFRDQGQDCAEDRAPDDEFDFAEEQGTEALDRRSAPRETVQCIAWIDFGHGTWSQRCIISNVSASGARLAVAPDVALPDEFQIALSGDARIRRRCKVSWRNGAEVGVHYLARPTFDFTV